MGRNQMNLFQEMRIRYVVVLSYLGADLEPQCSQKKF